MHKQLERELADFLGAPYISLFANGTLALVTALQALRITGEVITTPYSFVATTHSLWWNNIKPVFVDIEPEFGNLDPDKIEAAITPKTTAILPVHVYGNPCHVEKIQKIADIYGLKLIYDAAHAFGVKYKGGSIIIQTISGQKDERFSTWFDALNYMKSQIDKQDFDIALIGAGAYGFPLAVHVKRIGKKAIHMGVSLQLLFGIKGARWDNNKTYMKYFNDSWVRPDKSEIPKNSKTVEGGCYW